MVITRVFTYRKIFDSTHFITAIRFKNITRYLYFTKKMKSHFQGIRVSKQEDAAALQSRIPISKSRLIISR